MPKYARCIFCNRTDSPHQKEDVLAKWIAREFGDGVIFDATHGRLDAPPTRTFKTKGHLGWVTRGPCERCNNGWMSDLEAAAKPVLVPLMRGERRDVTEDECRVITRWLAKTAITWEYMRYASGRVFRDSDRRALYTSATIPGSAIVLAARYVGPSLTRVISGPFQMLINGIPGHHKGYCFTLTIMQCALQFVSVRIPPRHRKLVRVGVPKDQASKLLAIWPLSGTISWPPQSAIDEQGLSFFERLWRYG